MHVFLFHVHATAEHLLGLGLVGSNLWGHMAVCGISSVVAHKIPGLGLDIAADSRGIPLSSTGCLSDPGNVQCIFLNSFTF